MRRLALLIALAALPAGVNSQTAILPQGNNFLISPASTLPAIGGKPTIASDGTNFFIVWRDARNQATSGKDVFGARIAFDGTVLDPNGIPIATGTGDLTVNSVPSVGFDGTNYLVVWVGTIPGTSDNEIFGARVTPNGTVLDNPAIQFTSGVTPRPRPIPVAFDGTNYLIVWRADPPDVQNELRGIRVSPAGANLDGPTGFHIGGPGFYPWVVFDGSQYLVTWHHWNNNFSGFDVYGARILPDKTVLDPNGIVVSDQAGFADQGGIAFDGTNYLIAWGETQSQGSVQGKLYGARVSTTGMVLDSPALQLADSVRLQAPPHVVFDGDDFVVLWFDEKVADDARYTDVYLRRVSSGGGLVGEPVPASATYFHQFAPVLGYHNGTYLAAWIDGRTGLGCDGPQCLYGQVLTKESPTPPTMAGVNAHISSSSPVKNAPNSAQVAQDWSSVPSQITLPISSIWGFDNNNIYATAEAASSGQMLRFNGLTWSPTLINLRFLFGVWGTAPNNVYAVGWCWGITRFDGASWSQGDCRGTTIPGNQYPVAYGIWGSNSTNLLTVGAQAGFQSFDGTWHPGSSGVPFSLWDVWGTGPNNMYAVGEQGTILRYNGGAWVPQANVPTLQSLNAIWGSGPSDIFAVGDFGAIVHFDGNAWTTQASGTTHHLFGVWGKGPADVYAVGWAGTILHYDGNNWQAENSGTTVDLHDVWVGGNAAWAVGDQGLILKKSIPETPPAINPGGVVNAASFAPGQPVAPGSIAAVFGSGLASYVDVATAVPLPTNLGNSVLLLDTGCCQFLSARTAPEFFSSSLQVNLQIPWELAGQSPVFLTDTVSGSTSSPEAFNLATFSPGLFATNQGGTGQGAILIANTPNLAAPMGAFPGSRPAVRGVDFLEIYCTGLGAVTNQPATGAAASANPLSATTTTPTVTIGGVNAPVLFSGLAPGFVGLYVVTLQVPMNAPTGESVPVQLTIGGVPSNIVTMAIE
ncbi:MAG TPA: hypothetical protein VNN18_06060 [Candidatus Xenobia bacterium]|nr:hypothetical protein [Candidatus Xenobia bacterium]